MASEGSVCPVGTKGECAASGRFAEGESEAEVASLTSTGRGSGLCADQAGRAEGRREAASDPQVRGLTSAGCGSTLRDDQTDRAFALAGFGVEPQSLVPQHIQRERHECRRHNVARLIDTIRFVNGLAAPGPASSFRKEAVA